MFPPRLPTLPATDNRQVFIRPQWQGPPRAPEKGVKKRCSIALHRSEIRWYLFPVIYQISSQFHIFISVPEPQDQLTI